MNKTSYNAAGNQLFNHNFMFPDKTLEFPAGWQKSQGHRTANISWVKDDKDNYRVVIKNHKNGAPASIRQEASYCVPVYEKQVWELGAVLGVHHYMCATLKVHFTSHSSCRAVSVSLDFRLEPNRDYYYGSVTVPAGADCALIEIGTSAAGTLCIENVLFRRVFPVEKYDMDARGRLNINNVESVTRILEPVNINGTLELVRPTRNFVEDVKAVTTQRYSTMQDVFQLASFSFCVINQGLANAVVGMQLSPNGNNWIEDPVADDHIEPGQMNILVYNRFARYVRLRYQTDVSSTDLRIYFQGQG